MITPLEVLKKYWKYNSFRAPQEEVINTVLQKKNVYVLLPTGAGKSLCFQIPALINNGVCIVISPLIALMQDQVASLKKKGIKAIALTASLNENEIVAAFDNLQFGNYKFLYLSPERLQSDFIQEKIKQLQVNLIAIDEAHCISEWGHDFRPSYLKTVQLCKLHPKATVIALTASATKRVTSDIINNLELKNIIQFKATLERPELAYKVLKIENIEYKVSEILKNTKAPAIIYTSNRKSTKYLSDFLNRKGFKTSYYHGGLSIQNKQESYKNWLDEKTQL